jgi:hypothetical protein
MKAKKALKRLTRVETLLSAVIDQYAASEHRVPSVPPRPRARLVSRKPAANLAPAGRRTPMGRRRCAGTEGPMT